MKAIPYNQVCSFLISVTNKKLWWIEKRMIWMFINLGLAFIIFISEE